MIRKLAEHYDQQFYANQIPGSITSATIVLKTIFDRYLPDSMLDIGCGQGTWLSVAETLGTKVLHGIDGPWVQRDKLLSRSIVFSAVDMQVEIPIKQRYELAMSVEVAEHLSAARSASIVNALCSASDVVLFGAAVIGQGGEHHINEQRQSYWASLFEGQGYVCLDTVRPSIWNNEAVAPWYRQNTLIYVNRTRPDLIDKLAPSSPTTIIDIIHPEMFERRVASYRKSMSEPSLRLCLGLVKSLVANKLGLRAR